MGINRLQSGKHYRKEWEPHTIHGPSRRRRDQLLAREDDTRTSLELKQYREAGPAALDRKEVHSPIPGIPRTFIRGSVVYRGPTEYRVADSARIISDDLGVISIVEQVRKEIPIKFIDSPPITIHVTATPSSVSRAGDIYVHRPHMVPASIRFGNRRHITEWEKSQDYLDKIEGLGFPRSDRVKANTPIHDIIASEGNNGSDVEDETPQNILIFRSPAQTVSPALRVSS